MKLKHFSLHRSPSFRHRGFRLLNFSPGLNIIIGPNASGKTSICQAIQTLLWPKDCREFSLESEWEEDGERFGISLEGGQRTSSAAAIPKLSRLPEEHLASCYRISLDQLFDGDDHLFAKKITQELTGGYDIEAALSSILRPLNARSSLISWKKAKESFQRYQKDQKEVQREKPELARLEEAIKIAQEAQEEAQRLEQVLIENSLRESLKNAESALGAFSTTVQRASETFEQDLKMCQKFYNEREKIIEQIRLLEKEEEGIEVSAFCTNEEQEVHFERLRRVRRMWEAQKSHVLPAVEKWRSTLQHHCSFLGVFEENIPSFRVERISELHEHLEKIERVETQIASLEIQLSSGDVDDSSVSCSALAERIERILECLSLPSLISLPIAVGLFFGLVLSLYQFIQLNQKLELVFAGAVLFFGYLLWEGFKGWKRRKELLFPTFATLRESVHAWGLAVQKEAQLEEWKRKKQLLKNLEEQREKGKQEVLDSAELVGIEKKWIESISLYRFTESFKLLYEYFSALKGCEAEAKHQESALQEDLDALNRYFSSQGEAVISEIDELMPTWKRVQQRRENCLALEDLRKKELSLNKQIQQILGEIEDLNAFKELASQVGACRKARLEFERLEHAWSSCKKRGVQESSDILSQKKQSAEKIAAQFGDLCEQRGRLKSVFAQIEGSERGQRVLQEWEESVEEIKKSAVRFAEKELLEGLIEKTRVDFQKQSSPLLFQRTSQWFSRFTKGAFCLDCCQDQKHFEVIITKTQERKSFHALSRATRIQLLFAVRLAFALEEEKRTIPLPLFLDETLGNTDPERFAAIAQVLAEWVKEGRQVFYLTSNPEDASRWKAVIPDAQIIDLIEVQTESAFKAAPLPHLIEIPSLALPENKTLEEYAISLKISRLCLHEPLALASSYYLAETAEELYKFWQRGIRTFGNATSLKDLIVDAFPSEFLRIERRRALVERFYNLGNQGKSPLFSKIHLDQVTLGKNRLEALWELACEVGCDGKRFLFELKKKTDSRTKWVQKKAIESLRLYFLQEGYLDERETLSQEQIRHALVLSGLEEKEMELLNTLFVHTNYTDCSSCFVPGAL